MLNTNGQYIHLVYTIMISILCKISISLAGSLSQKQLRGSSRFKSYPHAAASLQDYAHPLFDCSANSAI